MACVFYGSWLGPGALLQGQSIVWVHVCHSFFSLSVFHKWNHLVFHGTWTFKYVKLREQWKDWQLDWHVLFNKISYCIYILCVFRFLGQFQDGVWPLSTTICDYLMTMDVMLCTASIFNLCAISVDRSAPRKLAAHFKIQLNTSQTLVSWGNTGKKNSQNSGLSPLTSRLYVGLLWEVHIWVKHFLHSINMVYSNNTIQREEQTILSSVANRKQVFLNYNSSISIKIASS